jgi:hypothetical protein
MLLSARLRHAYAVHPVDDPHRRPVHQDRRQRRFHLRQDAQVLRIFPG